MHKSRRRTFPEDNDACLSFLLRTNACSRALVGRSLFGKPQRTLRELPGYSAVECFEHGKIYNHSDGRVTFVVEDWRTVAGLPADASPIRFRYDRNNDRAAVVEGATNV